MLRFRTSIKIEYVTAKFYTSHTVFPYYVALKGVAFHKKDYPNIDRYINSVHNKSNL